MIRPIVMYPFSQPKDTEHLERLYSALGSLRSDHRYAKPITVINSQTHSRCTDEAAGKAICDGYKRGRALATKYSQIVDTWSVDTCGMWQTGFGAAMAEADVNDVFWLIPGDFHYSTTSGQRALKLLTNIPNKVFLGQCQLCLGQIEVEPNSPKQLIDTYGTYGLLYNWFPAEAQGIRRITSKPRTEFFAIHFDFLHTALVKERWYGYEQTIVILLQNMRGERTVRDVRIEKLGLIDDDPSARSTLSAAMQQIDRTERVLKQFWRELNEQKYPGTWPDRFRQLDGQSEQIRGAAMTIMQQLLPP